MTNPDWIMVPREPTEAMLEVMHDRVRILVDPAAKTADIQNDAEVWSAMLAVAPTRTPATSPEPDDAVVEKVARAICIEEEQDPDGPHPEDAAEGRTDGFPMWVFYTGSARAAIAAYESTRSALAALGGAR